MVEGSTRLRNDPELDLASEVQRRDHQNGQYLHEIAIASDEEFEVPLGGEKRPCVVDEAAEARLHL
eukprot:scaffold202575_cov31-Tisochrysis_lutea.AAC.2